MQKQAKKGKEGAHLEGIRHSLAHLLAAAVKEMYPKAKLGVGPVIEHGFYYDFVLPKGFSADVLPKLEARMKELARMGLPFKGEAVTPQKARSLFKEQPFKLDLIKDFSKDGKKLTVYKTGDVFFDLCRGGHVKNTKEIHADAFTLSHIAGAYWKGDEKNAQLTRIYGLAFETKEELVAHQTMLAEAKKRDHKILGPQLDLFVFSDLVGPGLPLWTPKGTLLRNTLDQFVWELRKARGYMKVEIPHITKKDLYEKSGHWDKFKDELFRITTREGHLFAMKPMNCPHHTQIYARRAWSYRELPQRYANTTMVYRDEQSGELGGLLRVRSITQDDAHVFCRITQAEEEIKKIWDIIETFYGTFGITLHLRISLHDPKHKENYLGNPKSWKEAEGILRTIATSRNMEFSEAPGEAAFYGPKLDFIGTDSLGRTTQVATIQLDLNMPERFDLSCTNEKGEPERIVMIHAAIMGSIERFLSLAIEHFAGAFPLWLAPEQVRILAVSDKFAGYAKQIEEKLLKADIRATRPEASDTLGKRIREGELMKIPYLVIVGEQEETKGTVSIRRFGKGQTADIPLDTFLRDLNGEIEQKAR